MTQFDVPLRAAINPMKESHMFRGAIKYVLTVFVAVLAIMTDAAPAAAQSDILLQLRSGSPAGDRFRVDSAGGMVALGELGIGIIPTTGCNEVMMWYAYKAAFRAGSTSDGGACSYWDESNIGFYSWAGGLRSIAAGNYSLSMGFLTTAEGDASVALGQRASDGNFNGVFIYGDNSSTSVVTATAHNQFTVRASGGVRFFTNSASTVGISLAANGSSWQVISDRNRKDGIVALDGEDVLARIERMPVSSWHLIDQDASIRHIGPMAQDFHAAFGLNDDPLTINMSDLDGVTLAGVQALTERTDALRADGAARDARIATLEERVADLEAQNAALEERLHRIEEALGRAE